MEACKDGTSPAVIVRQCNSYTYTRLFSAIARTCAIGDEQLETLSSMFVASASPPALVSAWPETALTFWAFPPSDEAWHALQRFLLKTLRPRVFQSSETRQAQKELFMVVPLKPLVTSPSLFEIWIEKLTDVIGMSAGCVCFCEYFGAQMLSSMMRIEQGKKLASNFPCQYHKDFSMMFARLAEQHSVHERVRNVTGLEFSPSNFINIALGKKRLANTIDKYMAEAGMWRRMCAEVPLLAEIMDRRHLLSQDAKTKISDIIRADFSSSGPSTQHTLPTAPTIHEQSRAHTVVYSQGVTSSRYDAWGRMLENLEQNLRQAPQTAVQALDELGVRLPVTATIDTSWSTQPYVEGLIDDDRFIYTFRAHVTE